MKLWLPVLVAALAGATVSAENTNTVLITPGFINQLAEEAQTNNAALRGAEKLIDAARANEESIRTWEDPTIRVGRMAAERSMRRDDGDLFYGVEQKLPLFGKPEAARMVAESETAVEKASADLRFQTLRRDLALAVFRTALAERTARIAEQDLASLETLVAVAEQRYEAGTAGQLDLLRLQNERARRVQEVQTDTLLIRNAQSQVNRLIGRPLQTPLPTLELPEIATPIAYSDRLVEIALRSEPIIKRMQLEADRAGALSEQTRRQRYPDFVVGLEGRNYTGSGEFREGSAYVAFNFPWGNRKKYDADFRREKSRQEAIELDTRDYSLEVRNEIFQLITRIDAARREALLYRDQIIPRSQIALDSARDAWEANTANINDLLDARRLLFDAELMYARAIAEQYQLLSELVLCCGLGDLEALEMIASELAPPTEPSTP